MGVMSASTWMRRRARRMAQRQWTKDDERAAAERHRLLMGWDLTRAERRERASKAFITRVAPDGQSITYSVPTSPLTFGDEKA